MTKSGVGRVYTKLVVVKGESEFSRVISLTLCVFRQNQAGCAAFCHFLFCKTVFGNREFCFLFCLFWVVEKFCKLEFSYVNLVKVADPGIIFNTK